MKRENNFAKILLLEFIDFVRYKVETDRMTMDDMEAILRTIESNMHIHATIDDLSAFYGKSKDAVNSVIKRRMIQKPLRNVVLYPFHVFLKLVPDSWHINAGHSAA